MKYDIKLGKYQRCYSAVDGFTTATVDDMVIKIYCMSSDMATTNVVIANGVAYTRTNLHGVVGIPTFNGTWVSSDGSQIPEWVDYIVNM